jgi:hypothetical protein
LIGGCKVVEFGKKEGKREKKTQLKKKGRDCRGKGRKLAAAGLNEKKKMPLVRYEVRCEHSLANPELFRAAGGGAAAAAGSVDDDDDDVDDAKAADDDVSSQGLLEGVAVAGLVGIVRQLGNLVEYVPPSLPFSSIGSSHQILFV